MKRCFKVYSIIIGSLLGLTITTSLILSLIEKYNLITYKSLLYVSNTISYLYAAIFSFILGVKMKKNGLLNGFVFSLILFLITIIIGNSLIKITTIIKVITKSIIVIFFTVLGVNKKNPN